MQAVFPLAFAFPLLCQTSCTAPRLRIKKEKEKNITTKRKDEINKKKEKKNILRMNNTKPLKSS